MHTSWVFSYAQNIQKYTYTPHVQSETERQIDRQTDRQTKRQTDKETGRKDMITICRPHKVVHSSLKVRWYKYFTVN